MSPKWRSGRSIHLALAIILAMALRSIALADEARQTLAGKDLPQNVVVRAFYTFLSDYHDEGPYAFHHLTHHVFGMDPDSKCPEILESSMLEEVQVESPLPPPSHDLSQKEFDKLQDKQIKTRARLLGQIYWRMRKDLAKANCPTDSMDEFIESTVRSSVVISRAAASSEEFSAQAAESEFQDAKNDVN